MKNIFVLSGKPSEVSLEELKKVVKMLEDGKPLHVAFSCANRNQEVDEQPGALQRRLKAFVPNLLAEQPFWVRSVSGAQLDFHIVLQDQVARDAARVSDELVLAFRAFAALPAQDRQEAAQLLREHLRKSGQLAFAAVFMQELKQQLARTD